MVQSKAGFVKGKGFLWLRYDGGLLVTTFCLRSFYTGPAKFTSYGVQEPVQQA
jgi:hypothetical protein